MRWSVNFLSLTKELDLILEENPPSSAEDYIMLNFRPISKAFFVIGRK
jgi:hypothetical protein